MSGKVLFFINPISGTKNKLHLEEKIIKHCEDKNVPFEILFTSKEGAYGFLYDKIRDENITDIAICGGDGSVTPIVAAVLKTQVNIGIIPLGSGNGLAKTAGIPKSVDKAIQVFLSGKASATDVFFINHKLSTHVCGLGFDAKVAHDFSQSENRGLNSYTKIALKNFSSAKTYPFVMEAGGKIFSVEAFLICIANSNQFGNNFKVAPQASISDGLLDVVVIKKTSKRKAVWSFIKQVLFGKTKGLDEKDFHNKKVLYFQTDKIKIKNPQFAPLHIDGDPAESFKEFSIEILPSAYRLIHP